MIEFQELRIDSECSNLTIDVIVPNITYYEAVYIDQIIIDTQDTYTSSGPSSNPIYTYTVPTGVQVYDEDDNPVFTEDTEAVYVLDDYGNIVGVKSLKLILDKSDLGVDLDGNIFFVYAIASGTPASDTPCGYDNATTLGVVTNMYSLYQQGMYYINELSNTCEVSQNFIDYILRLKALELSIKTGNYNQAITLWNKYISGKVSTTSNSSKCGCYGTSS